jgi:hypothetical protein
MRTTGKRASSSLSLVLVGGLLAAVGCGGSEKGGGARQPGDEGSWEDTSQDEEDVGMIPPEKMDSIKATFDRKGRMVSRCLVEAIDAKEVGKNERAVITITATISPEGRTTAVKVDDAEPKSQVFADCVTGYVEKMEFVTLPRALDYSYTYAFDAL